MYIIGDQIVHPLHGAGVIKEIVSRRIGGLDQDYYILKLPSKDMVVMIPVDGCSSIGVRPVIKASEAYGVLDKFSSIDCSMNQNWNKRYRENMEKIKSGDLISVAEVVKGLMSRDLKRGLSTGERKMLGIAKQILISELVISLNADYEQIENRLILSVGAE